MKANVHPDLLPKGGSASRDVLILGIGNILWADEGFGPRAEIGRASCRERV